jgi:hypothetical protein
MRSTSIAVAVLLLGLSGPAHAQFPGGAFRTTTLDPQVTGIGGSIAIGADGLPLISYHDGGLKVVHCSNPACSRATTSVIDGDVGSGYYNSIVVGADGRGLISYFGRSGGVYALKVAHCDDLACTTATTTVLDVTTRFGARTAITIGTDNLGLIAYFDARVGDLKVAHCNDAACTSAGIRTLDSEGHVGLDASVKIAGDGLPLISYRDDRRHALKVARCFDAACSFVTRAVLDGPVSEDDSSHAGWDTSIAIGQDGLGLISYLAYDVNEGAHLRVAHCTDAICATATITPLDVAAVSASAVIGSDGLGLISYWGDGLRVVHCSDVACTSVTRSTIEEIGVMGSLTLGSDGHPILAYFSNGSLRVAHQPGYGDFDADGRADLVWRRNLTGENIVWMMNGIELVSAPFTKPPILADPRWRIVGTNDFNGDARTDLLWSGS